MRLKSWNDDVTVLPFLSFLLMLCLDVFCLLPTPAHLPGRQSSLPGHDMWLIYTTSSIPHAASKSSLESRYQDWPASNMSVGSVTAERGGLSYPRAHRKEHATAGLHRFSNLSIYTYTYLGGHLLR
ncbi:uncharacterized protein GGS25DRAFT_331914 [Hypoxylon fragiforme]|uniref:uncharacterized protein n=1 Tax=Hypoxylon fragiforme TaxID=63214 RepID=UPI0020C65422|nr:uncharacterized protein GGS25DRAFT_331914 [Hypoxylon fragiforme]KAI2607408.1 hypothetical protein GGS25DRAFT_331914 [Hypoxylon fragiforme]